MRRVVVAQQDPFAEVAGRGIDELRRAGIEVEVGLLQDAARELTAPYLKLVRQARPWIIAKWAMTLDGKIATDHGDSRWISCPASREIVHAIRGRMDAILVGRGTAAADDPLLTARPPGPRVATRIVLDSWASLAPTSQLVRTARDVPVIVAAGPEAPPEQRQRLAAAGCEVVNCRGSSADERLLWLLDEIGRRRMTNVLVEGGAQVLGSLFAARQIDEVHVFIAPRVASGQTAPGPTRGPGAQLMEQAWPVDSPRIERCGDDVYVHGRMNRT